MLQLPLDVAGALSVWLEVLLYGVYCSLFFESLYIIFKKMMTKTTPAKVFLIVSLMMFILATIHIGLNLYRLLRGYIWLRDSVSPANYFLDLGRWDNIAHDLVNALMTWCADFLVIYRCFLVWNSNYFIIIVPAILLCMSIVANSVALHLFTQAPLGTIFGPTLVHWMNTIYAVAFVQNTITTSLIAYRIWHQDRASVAMGVRSHTSRSSLVPIIRIIVESAAIYLIELFVLIVLYSLDHNGQFVVQEAVVPTVGIVFTLMTVRFALRTNKTLMSVTHADGNGGSDFPMVWRMPLTSVGTATTNIPSTIAPGGNNIELNSRPESVTIELNGEAGSKDNVSLKFRDNARDIV